MYPPTPPNVFADRLAAESGAHSLDQSQPPIPESSQKDTLRYTLNPLVRFQSKPPVRGVVSSSPPVAAVVLVRKDTVPIPGSQSQHTA